MTRAIAFAFVVATLTTGCVGERLAARNDELLTQLRTRAAFDLQCDEAAITTAALESSGGLVRSYGVTGCERRATYVLVESTWVANTAGSETCP